MILPFVTGGTTLDVCGCCTVCAKVEGEACGGPWNLKGVCDKGLKCKPKSDLRPGNCVDRKYDFKQFC